MNAPVSSDGPQPHFISIEFPKKVAIQVRQRPLISATSLPNTDKKLSLFLSFNEDDSYTPATIEIRAGTGKSSDTVSSYNISREKRCKRSPVHTNHQLRQARRLDNLRRRHRTCRNRGGASRRESSYIVCPISRVSYPRSDTSFAIQGFVRMPLPLQFPANTLTPFQQASLRVRRPNRYTRQPHEWQGHPCPRFTRAGCL